MQKIKILSKIIHSGVVAVVRAETAAQALKIVRAVQAGGITAVELTMTVPHALDLVKEIAREKDKQVVLGVGSVLDGETARAAILAGAEYVVSPHLNREVAVVCNRYQIPSMLGAATPKEVLEVLEAGADVVKLFPGEVLGPQFARAIKGPLPQAPLMPTGGVSLANVQDWVRAGAMAVGVGGALTQGAKVDDYELVTATAREFIAKFQGA